MRKTEIHHIDGNKENNLLINLEKISHSENVKYSYKLKLQSQKGEKNGNSKLTKENIIKIKQDLNKGFLTNKEIAKKFGVNPVTISDIKTKKSWSHIK